MDSAHPIIILGLVLTGLGFLLVIVSAIQLVIAAFKQSVLWGLGYLFLPIVWFIFLFMHWDKARKPFFLQLFGVVLVVVGHFLSIDLVVP